jgi:hypothetical protein
MVAADRAAAFTHLDSTGQSVGRLGERKFVETPRMRYAGSASLRLEVHREIGRNRCPRSSILALGQDR